MLVAFECICFENISKMVWFSRIILGVDQAFIWIEATVCAKILFPPTNFVCLLFSYCFKCLYIFYISDGSGRRYCLFKNIHFPSPISFASFLVIILINYYFLILATVQADTTICAQISFPPPISFASFKVIVLINYYFYIKNQYFNSTFKVLLNKIVYNSGAVNSGLKGYQKQKKVLLNNICGVVSVALFSLPVLVYPSGHKRQLLFVFIKIFIRGAYA